jgi:hypothetical protein
LKQNNVTENNLHIDNITNLENDLISKFEEEE